MRERLGLKSVNQTNKLDPTQLGYTWTPPGIVTPSKVKKKYEKLNKSTKDKTSSFWGFFFFDFYFRYTSISNHFQMIKFPKSIHLVQNTEKNKFYINYRNKI